MRRIDRLFAITEALRARRSGITAEQLAERFEVSVRTIYRDLDSLRSASLPVFGERGRGGGLSLDRSYTLPPVNFTIHEAAILTTACQWMERARLIPFLNTLRSASDKVHGALPSGHQRLVRRLGESLSWVGVPARWPPANVLSVVEQAWLEECCMRIEYDGAKGISQRTVRITSVVIERTVTLLNCHDLDIDQERQFAMHKIKTAHLVNEPQV